MGGLNPDVHQCAGRQQESRPVRIGGQPLGDAVQFRLGNQREVQLDHEVPEQCCAAAELHRLRAAGGVGVSRAEVRSTFISA